jgi:hypothetical protein
VHYHGADAHFLQSLGYAKPMVDLGKIIHRFLLPVRRRMQGLGKDCTLSQSVACVVLNGEWRSPHLSVNDAWMLYESFEGLVELLDSVSLSYLCASASHLLSQRLAHRCICIASSRATASCPCICSGVCRMF